MPDDKAAYPNISCMKDDPWGCLNESGIEVMTNLEHEVEDLRNHLREWFVDSDLDAWEAKAKELIGDPE